MNSSLTSSFLQAVSEAGIRPPQAVVIDGKKHRFPTNDDPGDTAGWYVIFQHGDLTLGAFGDWRTCIEGKWSSRNESQMTKVERNQIRKEINRIRKEAEEEREKIHQETANEANRIWNSADLVGSDHPYLIRKGVKAHGLKQNKRDGLDILLVPLLDENDKIWSLQRIYPDKRAVDKIFLKNGRVSGLFFTIGDPSNERVVCEGFATGASIHEATGYCVHVAFNAGNLKAVAQTIRRVHSDVDLFIATVDDLIIYENSKIKLSSEKGKPAKIKLLQYEGFAWSRIPRLKTGDSFIVEMPAATAGIRGTAFSTSIDAQKNSQVCVCEGTVKVSTEQGEAILKQGELARTQTGKKAMDRPVSDLTFLKHPTQQTLQCLNCHQGGYSRDGRY